MEQPLRIPKGIPKTAPASPEREKELWEKYDWRRIEADDHDVWWNTLTDIYNTPSLNKALTNCPNCKTLMLKKITPLRQTLLAANLKSEWCLECQEESESSRDTQPHLFREIATLREMLTTLTKSVYRIAWLGVGLSAIVIVVILLATRSCNR